MDVWRSLSRPLRPFSIVLQDALREVTKNYPPLKLMVFEDDVTASINERSRSW